jgi:hypothetical protein
LLSVKLPDGEPARLHDAHHGRGRAPLRGVMAISEASFRCSAT